MAKPKKSPIVLIGGDPEVFVASEGRIVPVCGRIGGTKKAAIPINKDYPYTWLEDNAALEFNFKPTASSGGFVGIINEMTSVATGALRDRGLKMVINPEHKFKHGELDKFQQAMEIGCDPDYNAHEYAGKEHYPRECPTADTLGDYRFAAGHIHVGYDVAEIPAHAGTLFFDAFVVLPLLKHDPQGNRRKYYGKAGLYRPKPYGFEHRTMSNWWLKKGNASHAQAMAEQIINLYGTLQISPVEAASLFSAIPHEDVKELIEKEDHKLGRELFLDISRRVPNSLGLYNHLYSILTS